MSASRCCSRASSAWSTAATTRPGSRSSRTDGLDYVRAVGPLDNLKARAGTNGSSATTGLGHTRWATHGGVTEANAHPLAGCDAVEGLDRPQRHRRELPRAEGEPRRRGAHLHLRDRRRDGHASRRAPLRGRPRRGGSARLRRARGPLRVRRDPPRPPGPPRRRAAAGCRSSSASARTRCSWRRTRPRSCARRASSSSPATARSSPSRPEGATFQRADGTPVEHDPSSSTGTTRARRRPASRPSCSRRSTSSPRPSPRRSAIASATERSSSKGSTCRARTSRSSAASSSLACGTAYHACVVGRYLIEEWARVPVEFDIACEWIYRNPVLDEHDARHRDHAVGRDARHDRGAASSRASSAHARSPSRT